MILATKCGLLWENRTDGSVFNRLKGWSVRQECEDSLRRLGIDVIDLYQIHWPNPDADLEEAWTEIAKLVEEGKIRYAGVSNFSVEQIRRVQAIHPVASLSRNTACSSVIPKSSFWATAPPSIGVVAYSPMASGLLTGKYTRARVASLPAEDWRTTKSDHFREPGLSANLELVDSLRVIAERSGRSLGNLALAWVLRRPEMTSAILGRAILGRLRKISPGRILNSGRGSGRDRGAITKSRGQDFSWLIYSHP